jgi:purine-binding chemotaxis protein CheW
MAAESYILFELAATTYALRTHDVQHMEMVDHITPVPNAPAFVEGVIFSRGQVIPAVNLRIRFGFPKVNHSLRSRLVVVQAENRKIGLIVDAAREFRTIPAESIQPPHNSITGLSGRYLSGIATIADRVVLVLDIAEILNFGDFQTNNLLNAQAASPALAVKL